MALIVVPNAGQTLAVTRDPIRNNFGTINAAFLVDHVEYSIANQGKHNKSTYPEQAGSPVTLVNEGAVFTRQGANTAVSELCYRRENNGSVTEMTESVLSTSTPGNNTNGWTRLPSGILMKWGVATINAGAPTINLDTIIGPAFGAVFNIQATAQNASSTNAWIVSFNTGTHVLTLNCDPTNRPVYWFAIGR